MTTTNRSDHYTTTGYPRKAVAVTQDDSNDLPGGPAIIRADGAGQVTVIPAGNDLDSDTVTYNLAAGEAVPCLVRRVLNTGTDAIVLHAHYD